MVIRSVSGLLKIIRCQDFGVCFKVKFKHLEFFKFPKIAIILLIFFYLSHPKFNGFLSLKSSLYKGWGIHLKRFFFFPPVVRTQMLSWGLGKKDMREVDLDQGFPEVFVWTGASLTVFHEIPRKEQDNAFFHLFQVMLLRFYLLMYVLLKCPFIKWS